MAVTIRRDALYTVLKQGYARSYPIEALYDDSSAFYSCLLFIEANQTVTIKVTNLMDHDTLLCMITKYALDGKVLDLFQAKVKRTDFGRMIDPDYPIY